VYSTEKFLSENSDKIPAEVKSEVESDVADLKKALEAEDVDAVQAAATKLATSSQKMGAAMYADAGAANSAGAGDAGTSGDDDIVDAEIVDEPTGPQESTGSTGDSTPDEGERS
jgi:molecular chaperone DnaK